MESHATLIAEIARLKGEVEEKDRQLAVTQEELARVKALLQQAERVIAFGKTEHAKAESRAAALAEDVKRLRGLLVDASRFANKVQTGGWRYSEGEQMYRDASALELAIQTALAAGKPAEPGRCGCCLREGLVFERPDEKAYVCSECLTSKTREQRMEQYLKNAEKPCFLGPDGPG